MKRIILTVGLWPALVLSAQTAQTVTFRAAMSGVSGDSGAADILLHLVRDSSGNIVSGSVDFDLAYEFPTDTMVTELGLTDTGDGTLQLATNITAASSILASAGRGQIFRQVQVPAGDQAGLTVLNGILNGTGDYHVLLVSPDYPAGAMEGELHAAQTAILMAVLSSSAGSGVATVSITYSGVAYSISSAEVAMQSTYQFPAQVTFSGMRVYAGQGESGQIAVAADLMPGTPSASGGAGVLTAPATQIDMTNIRMVQAVQSMLLAPASYSVDVNTVEDPSAPLTGQLRATDSMSFQIPAFAGTGAASEVRVHTLRQQSGSVLAGTVIFDVNYRLAAGTQITGMDLDGNMPAPAISTDPSGSGNAYALVAVDGGAALTSLNNLVISPATHKVDVVASSTMSASLAVANVATPVVAAVIPIVEVTDLSTFAPGELVEIYGTNLSQVTTDLSGWPGVSLPNALNGVSVILGGHGARVLYVSSGQVDVVLPFGAVPGAQPLTLTNANGTSAPFSLSVATIAPALYNFAFENSNFTLLSQNNPASAGDVLVFYMTGMGQTTPTLLTGQTVPNGPPYYNTASVKVTIAGVNANVIYSIGAPPYVAGLYQMAVTVPAGVPSGNQPVIATSGGIQSNTVTITVK